MFIYRQIVQLNTKNISYTYNPAFCGLCKEIITFVVVL